MIDAFKRGHTAFIASFVFRSRITWWVCDRHCEGNNKVNAVGKCWVCSGKIVKWLQWICEVLPDVRLHDLEKLALA
jgi:hypothetical protein